MTMYFISFRKDKRIASVIEREASGKLTATQKQAFKQRRKARNQKLYQVRTRAQNKAVNYDLWGGNYSIIFKKFIFVVIE